MRDAFAWRFTRKAQSKAFAMDHFVRRRGGMTAAQQAGALKALDGRRTPQLRPQFEAVLCARKPREGVFVDNWLASITGCPPGRADRPAPEPDGPRPGDRYDGGEESQGPFHRPADPLRAQPRPGA